MHKSQLLSLSLAMLYASPSFATLASLGGITTGEDCGPFSSQVIEEKAYDDLGRGYVGESLRVFFDEFVLTAEYPGYVNRNCKLKANVTIPAGYKFRPTLAAAEGTYNIEPKDQSKAGIKVSYVVEPSGQRAERQNAKPFTGTGDILCKAELQNPKFTTCYNRPNSVTLDTDLGFWIDQAANGYSLMQLDATRTKTSLKWNWQFASCENFWDQKWFATQYKAYDGKTYQARMFFDLNQGRYESSAGFTGYFSNIQYSEDGLTVTANWVADSAQGWLKLTMSDASEGRFVGEWGDNNGFKAPWSGQYESAVAKDYYAFHVPNQSACIDSSNPSLTRFNTCYYSNEQLFYTTNAAHQQFFHIKSKQTGKCLAPASTSDTSLRSTICGESDLDGWEFYVRGQSPYRLKNKATGLCMVQRGDRIQLANCDSGEATWLTWSIHKKAAPAQPVAKGPSGYPYCDSTYYGDVFNCNGRKCAKSDPQYLNICELKGSGGWRPGLGGLINIIH